MAKWINTNTGKIVYNNDKEALDAYERTYIENHKLDDNDEWLDVCDFSDWVNNDRDIIPDISKGIETIILVITVKSSPPQCLHFIHSPLIFAPHFIHSLHSICLSE